MAGWLIALIVIGAILGFVLFAFLSVKLARLISPSAKGKRGEERVTEVLNEYVTKHGGYVVNDVILPYGSRTQQIDHVLFASTGIFVIETKNWGGMIFGSDQKEVWSQVMGINRIVKHEQRNPVKQNEIHIKAVANIVRDKSIVYKNLVVFTRDNVGKIYSKHCIGVSDLLGYLEAFRDKKFTNEQLIKIYKRVKFYKDQPVATMEEHVRNIRKDHPNSGDDYIKRDVFGI